MKCELCGSTVNLQRHHVSYDPKIIQVLCVNCHKKIHKHGVGVPMYIEPKNMLHHGKGKGEIEPQYAGTDYFKFYHKPCSKQNTHDGLCEIAGVLLDNAGRVIFNLRCMDCGFEDVLKTGSEKNDSLRIFHISPKHQQNVRNHRWDNA